MTNRLQRLERDVGTKRYEADVAEAEGILRRPARTPSPLAPAFTYVSPMSAPPDPGPVYDFAVNWLKKTSYDVAGFKKVLSNAFDKSGYTTLIAGEWSHDRVGEQALAIDLFEHVAAKFAKGTFAMREETQGGSGEGIFSAETSGNAKALISKHGIANAGLADGDQYASDTWVPALLKSNGKLFTYTGSAHTSEDYVKFFKAIVPDSFSTSPGPGILEQVRKAKAKGIAVAIATVDDAFEELEEQAIRRRLQKFEKPADFEKWADNFAKEWTAVLSKLSGTKIIEIAKDVYTAVIGPYSGLRILNLVKTAWADTRLSDPIRKDRTWTLYDVLPTYLRFEDDKKRGKHFLKVEFNSAGTALKGPPVEENW